MTSVVRSADTIHYERRVLFAVELVDPITLDVVHRGITVTAAGIDRTPVVSSSGRFVWLDNGDKAWPATIAVNPGTLPFAPEVRPVQPKPANGQPAVVLVVLQPTSAYPFGQGLTAVRGTLVEDVDPVIGPASPPVADAVIQLAWRDIDDPTIWLPLPPTAAGNPPALAPRDPVTNRHGDFIAFIGDAPPQGHADVLDGMVKVRIQVTRRAPNHATRWTPVDYPFVPPPAPTGRIPEGNLLPRDLKLVWKSLKDPNNPN